MLRPEVEALREEGREDDATVQRLTAENAQLEAQLAQTDNEITTTLEATEQRKRSIVSNEEYWRESSDAMEKKFMFGSSS